MAFFVIPVVLNVVRIATAVGARKIAQNGLKKAGQLGVKASTKAAKPGKIVKTGSGYAVGSTIKKIATNKVVNRSALALTAGSFVLPPLLKQINKKDVKSSNTVPSSSRPFGGKSVIKSETAVNSNVTPSPIPEADPSTYKWNLPPHRWSMPLTPTLVNNIGGGHTDFGKPNNSSEAYRRGRLWWNASAAIALTQGSSSSETTGNNKQSKIEQAANEERKFGFQFLWNPESFATAVSTNLDTTPNVKDMFIGLVGAFPANQTITFNIVLDRTNDFACANAKFERPGLKTSNVFGVPAAQVSQYRPDQSYDNKVEEKTLIRNAVREFSQYYIGKEAFEISADAMEEKLIDLFNRGTIADVEFLYKAINGPGSAEARWTNNRGIPTSDIGFLIPTLLNIDIGPLAYRGYVLNLGVQHTRFTPDMIPISTNVSISLNLIATAGLINAGVQ